MRFQPTHAIVKRKGRDAPVGFELINHLKKQYGWTNEELARRSGVPKATVDKITSGRTTNPGYETVCALAVALGCSVDDFRTDTAPQPAKKEEPITISLEDRLRREKMAKLDSYGRRAVQTMVDQMNDAVDSLLQIETQRVQENEQFESLEQDGLFDEPLTYFSLPLYDVRVSAGTGQFLDSDHYEIVELKKAPPRGANFMVQVSGDSMEPRIHDGDRLFVRRQPSVEEMEIGVFYLDGEVYVKEFWGDHLGSLNPAYDDIELDDFEQTRCYGKVIGICRE